MTETARSAPQLSMIAAVARNGVIGHAGDLVWQEPADQRHFRATTQGHAVLMGRKTWDSLPERFRPLPNRRNMVVSRQAGLEVAGAEVFNSLHDALAALPAAERVFVIGGGELYALALPLASELVLTEIDANLLGDTHFPPLNKNEWTETSRPPPVGINGHAFAFVTYQRAVPHAI